MDRSHDSTGEGAPSGTQCWHQGGLLKLKLVDLWCVSLSLLEMPMLRFSLDVNVGSCEHCSWLWTSYYVDLLQGRFIELHVDPVVQYAPHHLMSAPCPDLPQRIECPQSTLLELFQEQISNMSYIIYHSFKRFMFPPSVNPHLFFPYFPSVSLLDFCMLTLALHNSVIVPTIPGIPRFFPPLPCPDFVGYARWRRSRWPGCRHQGEGVRTPIASVNWSMVNE